MDDDDTIAPGWSLVPADICIGTGEFLTNGDVGSSLTQTRTRTRI